MAGAGYKLFNTGDVLTAAQVNTYLQEQAVMRFANAAARTTALSGVLAEGMMSYLDDTNSVEVYNGSAWVSVSSDQTPLTTKGDLFTYSTTDARLPVGNNGETLVADSSQTTGLSWTGNYAAGKNKVINGDLSIWQRGTTFSVAGTSFTADRFRVVSAGATVSRQNFTAGSAPVAGYEGQYYFNQLITTNNQNYDTSIRLENARTFAGQTVTLSFWARSTAGAQPLNVAIFQSFGTGGSPSADVAATYVSGSGNPYTPTASWVRYTFTFTLPSVSGKTFGTNNDSFLILRLFQYTTTATNTSIDIWGVQLEAGSVATAFQTATGTLAGELAACQRYFQQLVSGGKFIGIGGYYSASYLFVGVHLPVEMRTAPTATVVTGTNYYKCNSAAGGDALNSLTIENASPRQVQFYNNTEAGGTAGQALYAFGDNAAASIGLSAEL